MRARSASRTSLSPGERASLLERRSRRPLPHGRPGRGDRRARAGDRALPRAGRRSRGRRPGPPRRPTSRAAASVAEAEDAATRSIAVLDAAARRPAARRRAQRDGASLRIPGRRRGRGRLGRTGVELARSLRRHREARSTPRSGSGRPSWSAAATRGRCERTLDEARGQRRAHSSARTPCTTSRSRGGRGVRTSRAARWIEAGLAHCEGLELDLWRLRCCRSRVRLGARSRGVDECDVDGGHHRGRDPRLPRAATPGTARPRARTSPTGRSRHRARLLAEAERIASAATDPGWHAALACVRAEVAWLERRADGVRDETDGRMADARRNAMRPGGSASSRTGAAGTGSRRRPADGGGAVVAPARGRLARAADAWRGSRPSVRGGAGPLRGGRR